MALGENKLGRMIDSRTTAYGLFGFPIAHSLSPHIHNYLFQKCNLNAIYLCFQVHPLSLKKALEGAISLGLRGLNVTIPHKEKIIPYLAGIDREAKIIGAVNTVKIEKGRIWGFNTDGEGFILSLKKHGFSPKGKSVFILGAGGAGKAVSVYLAKEQVACLVVYDCIYSRAQKLVTTIKTFFPKVKSAKAIKEKKDINMHSIDLLINATGLGLNVKDSLPRVLCNYQKGLVVYDLIYNPPLPRLLREAKKHNLRVINGLWMLIYQALHSECIWWQQDFSSHADQIYKILSNKLK
ncbi:MAG: shikimate dehydrogenase [Candidatus Omnitrophota bacterium]|nr:MAG: shikimate dehydrogenase [Candidatus Omnitrophota bacterium]